MASETADPQSAEQHPTGRRRALFALEPPTTANFDDTRLEWRRLFSELLGTFFLVLVGAGGAVVNATSQGAITRAAAVAAPGLMVMAIILFMGTISGAHLNPAVSIAFALRGDFPWPRVPGYVLVQLVAATLACLFLWSVFGKVGMLGATEPGAGISDWQATLTELVLTFGLVSTILGTASRAAADPDEAAGRLRDWVLDSLLAAAGDGDDRLDDLFLACPKDDDCLVFGPADLLPVSIRLLRARHGWRQSDVADRLGISQQAYAKLERPGANPELDTLVRVERALGAPLLEFA